MATDKIDIKPTTAKRLFKNPELQKAYEKLIQKDEAVEYKYTEAQVKVIVRSRELAARLFNTKNAGEFIIPRV